MSYFHFLSVSCLLWPKWGLSKETTKLTIPWLGGGFYQRLERKKTVRGIWKSPEQKDLKKKSRQTWTGLEKWDMEKPGELWGGRVAEGREDWTGAAQKLVVEKAVRRARMLVWTLKCIIIGTKGVWRLAWTLTFGETSCLGSRNQFHRLLRNAVSCIALLKLYQHSHLGIIHCLLGTGVPFGLDLRFLRSEVVVP